MITHSPRQLHTCQGRRKVKIGKLPLETDLPVKGDRYDTLIGSRNLRFGLGSGNTGRWGRHYRLLSHYSQRMPSIMNHSRLGVVVVVAAAAVEAELLQTAPKFQHNLLQCS